MTRCETSSFSRSLLHGVSWSVSIPWKIKTRPSDGLGRRWYGAEGRLRLGPGRLVPRLRVNGGTLQLSLYAFMELMFCSELSVLTVIRVQAPAALQVLEGSRVGSLPPLPQLRGPPSLSNSQ